MAANSTACLISAGRRAEESWGRGWNASLPAPGALSSGRDVFHNVPIFSLPVLEDPPQISRMSEGSGQFPQGGRQTPAGGAHIFLGQPNFFFVTVNSKDGVPWMNQAAVQSTLVSLWREEATAWLAGFYLLMPDHLHFFCAPRDMHFGID